MYKPRQIHNGTDIPKGPGDRAEETGGEGEETGTVREGGEGKDSATDDTPSYPAEEPTDKGRATRPERERRRRQRRRMQRRKKRGKKIDAGTERPNGGPRSRSLVWGGKQRDEAEDPPPQKIQSIGGGP